MTRRENNQFYVDIATDVVREDWKKKSEMYPRLFNCARISKYMGVSPRAAVYKLNSDKTWNITFEELCRYADATGSDVFVLFETIMDRIKEIEGVDQEKHRNKKGKPFKEYCPKSAG